MAILPLIEYLLCFGGMFASDHGGPTTLTSKHSSTQLQNGVASVYLEKGHPS